MSETKIISMQSMTALWSGRTIKVIIIKRAADMCQMYAYLVGSARVQLKLQ